MGCGKWWPAFTRIRHFLTLLLLLLYAQAHWLLLLLFIYCFKRMGKKQRVQNYYIVQILYWTDFIFFRLSFLSSCAFCDVSTIIIILSVGVCCEHNWHSLLFSDCGTLAGFYTFSKTIVYQNTLTQKHDTHTQSGWKNGNHCETPTKTMAAMRW